MNGLSKACSSEELPGHETKKHENVECNKVNNYISNQQ